MKNALTTLLMLAVFSSAFAQSQKFELGPRFNPSVKKDKLNRVQFINDLSPDLWSRLSIPLWERHLLEQRRPNEYPLQEGVAYPQDKYTLVVDVVEVKISAICNGKLLSAQSSSDKLTAAQKNILITADLGTDISIHLAFKYKDQRKDDYGHRNKLIEGDATVTVVPDTEAEFPGGFKQITEYFAQQVIRKANTENAIEKVLRATVKFTVNEQGEVTGVELTRSSNDAQIDRLLLEAITKMPKWKPAVNAQGLRVKQQFSLPFGRGAC